MPLGIFEKKKQPVPVGVSSSQDKDMKGQTFLVGHHYVTVERKLAEGGFAIVFVVRCNRSNRLFALKRQFVNDQKQLDSCKREIQIIKSLSDHKNMVTYVDSCINQAGEGVFECMLLTQYYRYSVLALMNDRLVKGKGLRVEEILKIFCDICEAVSRLHHSQTPVIHRDLKVENILIDDRGTYVLCDFGSATTKVLSTEKQAHSLVEEEILKYTTLSYRAPEMIDLYSAKPITTKSDIWALGVMLYKLCYFSLPFGESALAIQNGSFGFPEQPEYFPELKALIRYLLEPDCEKRPDIYQASSVAFKLSGRKCHVPNLNGLKVPDISELLKLLAIHNQRTNDRCSESPTSNSGNSSAAEYTSNSATTTVAPRLRPKGNTPTARLPLPQKSATPWKMPLQGDSARGSPAFTPPAEDSSKIIESYSNPDLSSGSGGSSQVTPSQSTLSTSAERVAPGIAPTVLHRPEDLGFRDLEGPSKPLFSGSPFHTVEPPEGPLVSLSPPEDEKGDPGTMSSGAPSQSAPQLPQQPLSGFLDSPSTPVRSHRRNVSDTSAVFGGDTSRPSAFKPYRSSQPDVHAVGEALRKQKLLELSPLNTADTQHSSGSFAASSMGSKVPRTLAPTSQPPEQRTHSANETTGGGDGWNPFSNAPGFERPQGGRNLMDDLSFGESFDALPRSSQRKGSFSSTCNVKSSESLVMMIDEKDPFGAAPFNPPSRGSSAQKSRPHREALFQANQHQAPNSDRQTNSEGVGDGSKPDAKQGEAAQSALSTFASTIKHTNRYRKLIDTEEDIDGKKSVTSLNKKRSKSPDRLGVPDDQCDSDSVGSASDLQKRMELTSTDDSTGALSEPEENTGDPEADDQNINYEHFDVDSSDSHTESGTERKKQEEETISDRNSDTRSKKSGIDDFHPYFLNSETVDGLGHRPLLEDDELDEKNHSLPKSLELNVKNLCKETEEKLKVAESAVGAGIQVLRINVDDSDIQSPESNDTLCTVTPEPLSTPSVELAIKVTASTEITPKQSPPFILHQPKVAKVFPSVDVIQKQYESKERTPQETPIVIAIPSPSRERKFEKPSEILTSPSVADKGSVASDGGSAFASTDAFGAVPLQTMVVMSPISTAQVHSPPSTGTSGTPSPASFQSSPPPAKVVPVTQQQPKPSGILIGKSPVSVQISSVRNHRIMETIGSSSGEEEELYLSGSSRSSSKKGLSKKKADKKAKSKAAARHRHGAGVDDGGEDELVTGSPPALSFPHPVIPKRKNKESRTKKSKGAGEADASFVNTSFQLEDVDFCTPSPSVLS